MKATAYKWIRRISIPVAALLLAACQFDDLRHAPTAERVKVQLNLGMQAPVNAVATRAAKATFYNLWAFQFDGSGNLVGTPQQLSTTQTQVEEGSNLSVNLAVGTNQTIYLLSAGKKLTPNFADIKTLDDLKAYKMNYIISDKGSYASAIVDAADIPYAGCVKNANVVSLGQGAGMLEYNSPEGFSGSIGMEEMVAKVTLRYKYNVDTHTPQGVRLQNVNSHISLGDPASYTPTDGVEFKLLNLQQARTPDAQGYYTASWYVAKNMQGTNAAITSEMDRYYKPDQKLAPQYGLCLEVLGQSKAEPTKYSVHRIFVGNNNTSNFDVEANHHYSLTTEFTTGYIEGANTDPRLEESPFTSAKVVFFSSKLLTMGGLCTNAHSSTYDLDAHYDCRPIAVAVSNARVELGIYTDEACTQPAHPNDPANNWLQLSIEPNYTLAVNNRTSPLANSINTEVSVPSKLNFYLYNDEYVDVKQDNTSPKRSLYLKITTTELGASNPQTTTDRMRIDQRPIKVYGQFGEWDDTKKEYTSLLGGDQIEEYKVAYTESQSTKQSGMWGTNYNEVRGDAALTNKNNGMKATIMSAENAGNWPLNSVDKPDAPKIPRKIGGKVDLYQYNYYNTFSARYCYDRNRDLDGNGMLENPNSKGVNEIKWYLPSENQLIACYVDNQITTFPVWDSMVYGSAQGYMGSEGTMVGTNGSAFLNRHVKCVRSLTTSSPTELSLKVETMNLENTGGGGGTTTYAVIDASAMQMTREDNNTIYIEVPLYEYIAIGGGNAIMEADGVTHKQMRRIKSHKYNDEINQRFSKKFAVAPDNVATSDWANGGGWDVIANNTSPIQGRDAFRAVERGCPAYKGKDGKDAPGTWRLPTHKELGLMTICSDKLLKIQEIGLGAIRDATEFSEIQCGIKYGSYISSTNKQNGGISYYNRCIRDIP